MSDDQQRIGERPICPICIRTERVRGCGYVEGRRLVPCIRCARLTTARQQYEAQGPWPAGWVDPKNRNTP